MGVTFWTLGTILKFTIWDTKNSNFLWCHFGTLPDLQTRKKYQQQRTRSPDPQISKPRQIQRSGPDQRSSLKLRSRSKKQRSSARRSAQPVQICGPAANCAADPKKPAQILLYMLGTIPAAGPSIGQKKTAISSGFLLLLAGFIRSDLYRTRYQSR